MMSKERKTAWFCELCRNKQRRAGDNSNTPVRNKESSPPTHPSETTKKETQSVCEQPCGDGYVTRRNKNTTCRCVSKEEIRDILRSELKSMTNEIAELQKTIAFFNEEFEDMRSAHLEQGKEMERLSKENEALKSSNTDLTTKIRVLDQQSRAANLEIQCVPEYKDENLVSTVLQLSNIIDHPVNEDDIQHCARTAKADPDNPRPRTILVRLRSPRQRDGFLASAAAFNKANTASKLNTGHLGIGGDKRPIFVTENLSPENKKLHAAARIKAKSLGYRFVWVRNGRIFVKKGEESKYVLIKNQDTINGLA